MSKSDAGKGDRRRPQDISDEEMDRRWEMAFRTPKEDDESN